MTEQRSHVPVSVLALRIVLSGVSNCTAAVITNPLDVIRVRLQSIPTDVLAQPNRGPSTHPVISIVRDERAMLMVRGLVPSLLREATYGATRLGLYEHFRDWIAHAVASSQPREHGAAMSQMSGYATKLAAGMCSGCFGAVVSNPFDLLKTRRMAAGRAVGTAQSSVIAALVDIVRAEGGMAALWQGLAPNVQRAALLTASQVGSYDHIKQSLKRHVGLTEGGPLHALAALCAGLIAVVVTNPFDVAKTRMMNAAASAGRRAEAPYTSVWDCLRRTLRAGGFTSLYAGFFPSWLRIGTHTLVTMTVFEALRKAAGLPPL